MRERTARRLDVVAAWARLVALVGVILAVLVAFPLRTGSRAWPMLIGTFAALLVDVVPLAMLRLRYYPEAASLAFSVFDAVYALAMVYLGGQEAFLYCFVPILTLSIRFDWTAGLVTAGALSAGSILIAAVQRGGAGDGSSLIAALFHSLSLLLVAYAGGQLSDVLKKEPPLEDYEARSLQAEAAELRRRVERSRAIYEMSSMLGATLDPQRILEAALEISSTGLSELDQAEATLPLHSPTGVVFMFGDQGMYVARSRNLPPPETRLRVSAHSGVLQQVVSRGDPVVLGNLSEDRELRKFSPFRRCRSAICVPLRAGPELYGAVVFSSPRPEAFGEAHAELLSVVATQAAVALNNAQLYQDLQREKERILEVEEEERGKLARDLHDGPTQSVSAIAMRLNFARLMMDRDPAKVKAELFRLENLARRTTKEIRTMLFTLRPVVLETQGLQAAITQLVERVQEMSDLPINVDIEDGIEQYADGNVQAVAWFITEEALNNVRKYSNARNVWIRVYRENGSFVLEVEDDGIGFDYESTMATYDQRGSFGLLNYHERAALVNGRSVVQTAPGKGTTVRLIVPLRQAV